MPRVSRLRGWIACALLLAICAVAHAGGPRWVTGPPYFTTAGAPVVWYTNAPQYFTDPGDLSATVNHAAAEAIVAAAASVWNVPSSALVLGEGGSLDEHVSSANTYLTASGVQFPADVQASNYLAKQIAVVYDYDGTVTDLLLGSGASDPAGCRQSGVTESVDSIAADGHILHAILVLNGRCTGTDPAMQLQLQYQLMRAFGRVLGLSWSQTNDNVFTQSPVPTYQQALHWPVMHPIDIVCGPYTYQCMAQPFSLRMDDVSALDTLYYIPNGTAPPGKVDTLAGANRVTGTISFPTGQGMRGVNVLARRLEQFWGTPEDWYSVSAVTGSLDRVNNGNPVRGQGTTLGDSMGRAYPGLEGLYALTHIDIFPGESWQDILIDTEPVNPLYTGQYAVGAYAISTIAPSGTTTTQESQVQLSYGDSVVSEQPKGAAAVCDTSSDGDESSPALVPTTGWWSGMLCPYGHTAWSTMTVRGNRSLTMEATAQDESGYVSVHKMRPVLGVWNASDPTGTLPTLGAASTAFNTPATATTGLTVTVSQPAALRMVVAEERGDGRPDFHYQARVLYADSVAPASVSATGGVVTISGMGFRPGNTVTVNGAAATVLSWSANTIVATVPPSAASTSTSADVTVSDPLTGGVSTMYGALTYAAPVAQRLLLVSAPSGSVFVGDALTPSFSVRVTQLDGVTPIANQQVTFGVVQGAARFAACGASTCTLTTDATGTAATAMTVLAPGLTLASATAAAGSVTTSLNAQTRVRTLTLQPASVYVASGASLSLALTAALADNSAPVAGVGINWTALTSGISLPGYWSTAGAQGSSTLPATLTMAAAHQASLRACAWSSVCAVMTATSVAQQDLRLAVVSGAGQSVAAGAAFAPVVLQVSDVDGHPVVGADVTVRQTLDSGTPCIGHGRCPLQPVLATAQSTLVSDANGEVQVVPLQQGSTATVTNLAASSGTQGFVSLSVLQTP
ncbi:MAG: IPT/TIG domain-containing protein [Acidobacteriota bacterium]|nr:IPT/TIG domain-containing protein [Acidobacteriota bacterium]